MVVVALQQVERARFVVGAWSTDEQVSIAVVVCVSEADQPSTQLISCAGTHQGHGILSAEDSR